MCMPASAVRGLSRWNWDGEYVVQDCTVPVSRVISGRNRRFEVDVRQFVSPSTNSALKKVLAGELLKSLPPDRRGMFMSREPGSFDLRADAICSWVGANIHYRPTSGNDPWQLPEETLARRAGDCEDRAFLIAALLLASGVSGYHVRVALGELRQTDCVTHDHAWVMYKSETGRWSLLETLLPVAPRPKRERAQQRTAPQALRNVSVEYVPHYLFNDVHLWATPARRESFRGKLGRRWNKLKPSFIGAIHKSIIHMALDGVAPAHVLARLDRRFRPAVWLFGPIVDDSDRGKYHPFDHFDNGYIDESWERVEDRLRQYRKGRDLDAFAGAIHGVADFYSHSSYLHFAPVEPAGRDGLGAHAAPYDPERTMQQLGASVSYGAGSSFDLTSSRFSINAGLWVKGKPAAAAHWRNKLISGRYAQRGDSKGDAVNKLFIEGPAKVPAGLETRAIGSLPHHHEMAVDGRDIEDGHRLYSEKAYRSQFTYRRNTAVAHIRHVYRTGRVA